MLHVKPLSKCVFKTKEQLFITLNSHEQVYLQMTSHAITKKMCNMKHYHWLYISATINFMPLKSNATFSYETFSLVSGYYWPFVPLINMETLKFRFQWDKINAIKEPPKQFHFVLSLVILALSWVRFIHESHFVFSKLHLSPSQWESNTQTKQPIRFQR